MFGHQQTSLHGSHLTVDFLELDVFAVVVVKDLALVFLITAVDNRYTTARSRFTGSVFLFSLLLGLLLLTALEVIVVEGILTSGLLHLLILSLGAALSSPAATLTALEVVVVEGPSLLLLFLFLVAVVVVFCLLAQFLYATVGEVDDEHDDDGNGDEGENDGAKDELNHVKQTF